MALDQQENTQIEQNSILQNDIDNLQKEQTLDVVHDYQQNLNNFQTETESSILAQNVQVPKKSILTEWMDNKETSLLTQWLNEEKTPQTLSAEEMGKIIDNATLKKVANERIIKCKDLLNWLKWNRKWKRQLEEQVERAIKTDLPPMVEDNHVYNNLNEYKKCLWKIVFDYYNNREPARQIIMMWWRPAVINWSADTKAEARKDRRNAKNNANFQIDMSEIKRSTALYRLIWANANEWWDYCDFIWQWWIAAWHPVYLQYTEWFNNVRQYNPDIYRAITPSWQITYETYCQRNPQLYQTYCKNTYHQKSFNERIWTWLADIAERLGANKDNDPRKRQAREKAWSVVALGWAVVLWFQFLKNLFSNKKDNPDKRKNVWLFWAGLLGVLNLDKITNRAQDITWWHPAEKTRMLSESFRTYWFSDAQAIDMADRYIWAPVTTISALHFIPIYELESQHILENNNGEINFIYGNFENYVNKFSWDRSQKEQVLKAWKKLDKDKSIWTGLKAFWIATREKLRSLFWSDKKKTLAQTEEVQNWWWKMVERVQHWVNKDLYNHGLRVKNPDDMDTIMAEYGSWQKSKEEVNKLMLDRMKRGLLELASDDKSYTINDMLTKTEFTSKINLENMTMNWFIDSWWTEIRFDSYWDLFDAVNISNWIKNHFNRPAKSENPFHIDPLTWRIEFDNTNRYDLTHNETSVVKLLTLKKNSTLFKNRKFYVDYLNKQRKETRIEQNKVDLSWYPILKEIWIDFMDKDEAKNAEIRLDQIKKQLRTSTPWLPWYTPFFIKWKKLWFKKIDGVDLFFPDIFPNEFIWKSLNLSNFPSLTHNSDKFLKFMNNPNNNMRGYQVRQRI